jgi:TolB-like protein/class 3 adenylate cyclase
MAREQRRLAAIVAADVVGYSRLMGKDETGTLAALKTLRREIVDPQIAAHGGRIVKTTGDGLLLEFASVVDAVQCVVEVQTTMAAGVADVPENRRIAFRIGVNLGDIIIDGDDIFGDGVNIAARLQELAAPGGMCVSSRVYDDVCDRFDLRFDDGGTQALKNISRPIHVWRWLPGSSLPSEAAAAGSRDAGLARSDKPSIAVLAFANMGGDPEQEYFGDGLVEDIITALSRISAFSVMARNSSFTYKGRAVDVRKVGQELGVRYVLEGSVRKAGGRLRITGQLADTTTGNHIWADRYEGGLEEVFDFQDRITSSVVAVIEPKVRQAEIARAGQANREPDCLRPLSARVCRLLRLSRGVAQQRAGVARSRRCHRSTFFHGLWPYCHLSHAPPLRVGRRYQEAGARSGKAGGGNGKGRSARTGVGSQWHRPLRR